MLIASALLITLCLGWFFLLYRPEVSKVEAIREKTEDLLIQLRSLRVTEAQVTILEKRVEGIKNEIKLTQNKMIAKDDLQVAINQVRKNGSWFGLKFHKIIPDYPSLIGSEEAMHANSEVLELTVHFKMQGYYKNFGKFLSSLDKLPFYISLGEIRLVYNGLIHPEIDILMDAVLYLHQKKASKV